MTTTPPKTPRRTSFPEMVEVPRGPTLLERLLARDRPTWREVPPVILLLSLVGVVLYGRHVFHGGLYSDDWAFASTVDHAGSLGKAYDDLRGSVGFRPLGVLSLVIRFDLLGAHTRWHQALVLGLTILLCTTVYLFLRSLGLEKLHAGVIALLALACPYADATRLWATGSGANIAIALWLLGVVVALRGIVAESRRNRIALHAGALALYLASLLQYEVAYAAICLTGLLYLTRTGLSRRGLIRAAKRSAVDITVATVAAVLIVSRSAVGHTASLAHHARIMFDGGVQIFAGAVVPFGHPRAAIVLGAVAIVFAATIVAMRRLPRGDSDRGELLRWVLVAAGGVLAAVAGYALFAGAFDYYQPLNPGLANRTNAIASLGFIAAAYAAIVCLATLVLRPLGGSRTAVALIAVAGAAVIFGGYQSKLRSDISTWDDTWSREQAILNTLQAKLPDPPPGSTIYTFGHPVVSSNPGLPIFVSYWELRGAVQTVYDDPTLAAYPALPGTKLACGPKEGYLQGAGYPRAYGDVYGQLYLVEISTKDVERPDTRAQCRRGSLQFHPGPYQPVG